MATLAASHGHDLERLRRHFFASSSCGVCGKATIDAVRSRTLTAPNANFRLRADVLTRLPETLRESQDVFDRTGGLHGAALFDSHGTLLVAREDIGRHNAVDKVIGWAFLEGRVPLSTVALLVSGRGGFEIVQKAVAAGVPIVACVSAPSSLAVQLAREMRQTLVGFLRGERFVVYSGEQRITPVILACLPCAVVATLLLALTKDGCRATRTRVADYAAHHPLSASVRMLRPRLKRRHRFVAHHAPHMYRPLIVRPHVLLVDKRIVESRRFRILRRAAESSSAPPAPNTSRQDTSGTARNSYKYRSPSAQTSSARGTLRESPPSPHAPSDHSSPSHSWPLPRLFFRRAPPRLQTVHRDCSSRSPPPVLSPAS